MIFMTFSIYNYISKVLKRDYARDQILKSSASTHQDTIYSYSIIIKSANNFVCYSQG